MTRVGVDVGGTFTDVVAFDEASGALTALKVPSTPGHEERGFLAGLAALPDLAATAAQIVHGTTVATNALLERKGGRVAMLTTRGFRDVIEIGRSRRYKRQSLFDTQFVKPPPLIERPLRFEIDERVAADGQVVRPLTEQGLAEAGTILASASPDAVAICFVNAYANDAHERRAKDWLAAAFPAVYLCTSAEVHSAFQEYERFATAALNAYLMPVMADYIGGLERGLGPAGCDAALLIMGSNAGAMRPAAAARTPVRTILSGPTGGVSAAVRLADAVGLANLITCDMGGTSTDVAVIRNGEPTVTTEYVHAGMPIRGSMVEINTVGAGAGSIARLADDGALTVGPDSAGASPGPACYGFGGREPTVTDANLLIGRLGHSRPLGGHLRLDPEPAGAAVGRLAQAVGGVTAIEMAEGVVRIAVAKMVGAIREISVERGLDPRGFTLLAFGGAGPMHAALVAEQLGGNLLARLGADGRETIAAAARELTGRVRDDLLSQGFAADSLAHEVWADMHYTGQAAAFSVRLPDAGAVPDAAGVTRLFLERYEARYGHANPNRSIDIDAVRVVGVARTRKPPVAGRVARAGTPSGAAIERREVVFAGRAYDCPVYDRERLPAGTRISRPAIVEEAGSTTVLPPGWGASLDDLGNLWLRRE
jgi:N-methylhydantoinase A